MTLGPQPAAGWRGLWSSRMIRPRDPPAAEPLVERLARARAPQKRGRALTFMALDEALAPAAEAPAAIERLGRALDRLASLDPRPAEFVDLKFFCGFASGDIAALRGVFGRTVPRDGAKARVVLHDSLIED